MKKILIAATLLTSSLAMARPHGMAGCGLGSIVFKKDSQVLAATTNGSSYSQTFGITSGTSNCVDTQGHAKLKNFIEGNRVALESDVARGQGETLSSVAYYFGCSNDSNFRSALQQGFDGIFKSQDADSVFEAMKSSIKSQPQVAVQCSELG
jgi:hypothetical protein